jgi:membrane protein implicated in regulation of membrane protease activity
MERRSWSGRVILRYALLQVPGLAAAVGIIFLLKRWMVFPDHYTWVALGLWVLKDVVLFPFVWHAYDWDDPGTTGSMIGRRGRVTRKLAPSGYVQIGGELWRAEAAEPSLSIEEGEWITVESLDGLKLFVRPADPVS